MEHGNKQLISDTVESPTTAGNLTSWTPVGDALPPPMHPVAVLFATDRPDNDPRYVLRRGGSWRNLRLTPLVGPNPIVSWRELNDDERQLLRELELIP